MKSQCCLQPIQTTRNQRKGVREMLDKIKFFLEDATIPIIGGIIGITDIKETMIEATIEKSM